MGKRRARQRIVADAKNKSNQKAVRDFELYEAMTLLRRSSAASRHTMITHRGSRAANKSRAIRDSSGW